jgi:hypothetical protein
MVALIGTMELDPRDATRRGVMIATPVGRVS